MKVEVGEIKVSVTSIHFSDYKIENEYTFKSPREIKGVPHCREVRNSLINAYKECDYHKEFYDLVYSNKGKVLGLERTIYDTVIEEVKEDEEVKGTNSVKGEQLVKDRFIEFSKGAKAQVENGNCIKIDDEVVKYFVPFSRMNKGKLAPSLVTNVNVGELSSSHRGFFLDSEFNVVGVKDKRDVISVEDMFCRGDLTFSIVYDPDKDKLSDSMTTWVKVARECGKEFKR